MKTTAAYQLLSDKELADLYRSSADQSCLATLFSRYRSLLFGVCYKYLEDAEASEDAINDIYIELVEKLLKHEVEYPKAWLHTLARNHCLMKLRKVNRLPTSELSEDFMQSAEVWHPVEEVVEKEKKLTALEDCIGKLKKEQQQAVQLFYIEQKCYNEIAEITGIDWNNIRSQIQNGRRNLKICMEHHEAQSAK